jgi:non-specific serine/threonine protein kinase
VFVGGWTLDAAVSICGESQSDDASAPPGPDDGATADVQRATADGLVALVDKNLVTVAAGADGESRFGMFETIRAFALAELTASGGSVAILQRHANHFLRLAEQAASELQGQDQLRWLDRLEVERPNLRAALNWSHATDTVDLLARLSSALGRFWMVHGHLQEGRQWLALAIGGRSGLPAALQTQVFNLAATLAAMQGDYAEGQTWYEESLRLCREQNDTLSIARTLNNLGVIAQYQSDLRTARTLYEESLAYHRELGNQLPIAQALNNLGLVAYHQGNNERALACYEESLAISRGLRDTQGMARVLVNLARVACAQGDDAAALALHAESLPLTRALGSEGLTAYALEGIADLAVAQGRAELGLRLLAAAAALRESLGTPVPPVERAIHGRVIARARRQLGDTAGAAWAAGQGLAADHALDEALAYATGDTSTRADPHPTSPTELPCDAPAPAADPPIVEPLTRREREVLQLVAEGLSNKQIAARLSLSPLTVRTHLATIFGKLDVTSRTAAVNTARRHGLL